MAGYSGYSMSNNAVAAYEENQKPLSKWTKSEILELIENEEIREYAKKLTVTELKEVALTYSSWHHTSSYYNQTDFYSVKDDLTLEQLQNIVNNRENKKKPKKKEEPEEEIWECEFTEWSGSRNHPTKTLCKEIGVIKGNWFYRKDGGKKSINSNSFYKIRRIYNESYALFSYYDTNSGTFDVCIYKLTYAQSIEKLEKIIKNKHQELCDIHYAIKDEVDKNNNEENKNDLYAIDGYNSTTLLESLKIEKKIENIELIFSCYALPVKPKDNFSFSGLTFEF